MSLLGQFLADGLGDPEVDHLRHRLPVVLHHQHVRRLQVPVNDPLLVGMLDAGTDLGEQLRACREASACAHRSNRSAACPATNSITKYGRPLSVAPASWTLAMFG